MDREKLVEAMAEKLADVLDWMPSKFPRSMLTEAARAALAVAEPVVRADERAEIDRECYPAFGECGLQKRCNTGGTP